MFLSKKWEQVLNQINTKRHQLEMIPESTELYKLLIAGEDHRFKYHNGIDVIALFRASYKTFFLKKREGGSTIAMQLVRVLTNQYDKTLSRKLEEMFLAYKLTKYMEKKEILSLYLSIAYYGWNMHGLQQACKLLDLNPNELNIQESASLIARLKYPETKYTSKHRTTQIQTRTQYILERYYSLNIKEKYDSI